MTGFDGNEIERYLKLLEGPSAHLLHQSVLGVPGKAETKGYGYGKPLLVEYEVAGMRRRVVLHTIQPGPFGHEHMSDRAQSLLWDHDAFNKLPRHVRSLGVGAFRSDGSSISLTDAEEFFTLTEYGEGTPYAADLEKIRDRNDFQDIDRKRSDALCDYLVEIHAIKGTNPDLYVRRIRELTGHSECIAGLIDGYTADAGRDDELMSVERLCVEWRWNLKNRVHRLRQVHGDFHPWNILFAGETDFCVLDRSRGEWGDPVDDVTCLTMNYLFFSLQRFGRLDGHFDVLFRRFWDRYLQQTGDFEALEIAAPFLVFRALVMANPVWYPNLSTDVRTKLFAFMDSVLRAGRFELDRVNSYCGI